MPSNQTPNYQLSQWERSDKVQMEDFNADNAKIDAALKAEADARTAADASLSRTVAGKADASALDSLSGTVAGHTSVLGHKGDCQFYTTSYTGDGRYGKDRPMTLSFPRKPYIIFITGNGSRGRHMILVQGTPESTVEVSGDGYTSNLTWSGNSVSWWGGMASYMMTESGVRHQVVALLKADD